MNLIKNFQIPKYLIYDEQFMFDEDKFIELKSLTRSNNIQRQIISMVPQYICAFLNTEGGHLVLGVEDDGTVKGLDLDKQQRDLVRRAIDQAINDVKPQVDTQCQTTFIPVIEKEDYIDNVKKITIETGKYVVIITVEKSNKIYRLKSNNKAYIRREGGITTMDEELIQTRQNNNKLQQLIQQLNHQQNKLYQQIVDDISEKVGSKSQVITISGDKGVEKSLIINTLTQYIKNDQRQYSQYSQQYLINVSGSYITGQHVRIMKGFLQQYFPDKIKNIKNNEQIQAEYHNILKSKQNIILIIENITSQTVLKALISQMQKCIIIISSAQGNIFQDIDLEFSPDQFKFYNYKLFDFRAGYIMQHVAGISEKQANKMLEQYKYDPQQVINKCKQISNNGISIYEHMNLDLDYLNMQNAKKKAVKTMKAIQEKMMMMLMKLALSTEITEKYMHFTVGTDHNFLQQAQNLQLLYRSNEKYTIPAEVRQFLARQSSYLTQHALQTYTLYYLRQAKISQLQQQNTQAEQSNYHKADRLFEIFRAQMNMQTTYKEKYIFELNHNNTKKTGSLLNCCI